MLHTSVTLATLTSGSGAHSSEKKKCSRAKRLWVHCSNSSDYCSERVCRSLWARQRGTEKKVGQGKRGGQPQLSASLNVLTVHLNISLCHELFVSPNMHLCLWGVCVCVCAKGNVVEKKQQPHHFLLLENHLCSCPQGHFLLFAHLPSNPPVTPLALHVCISPDKRVLVEMARVVLSPTPSTLMLIQTLYPSLPSPEAVVHTHAQTSNCKHSRKM